MTKARDIASATTPNANAALLATFPHKNLIINGAMQVAQRGTSASSVSSGNTYHTVDRLQNLVNLAGTWTFSQDTDVPSGQGFSYSHKRECTTANSSLGASSYFVDYYQIEGQDLQQLSFGTSSAKSLTLSFWVKTNKTGTYQITFTTNLIKSIGASYTVNAANTWEKKTLTIVGDTNSAIINANTFGLNLEMWYAAGTDFTSGVMPTAWENRVSADRAAALNVNLADSTSNYLNIVGLQLEVGDTATPFEHRLYADELRRCQRYYEVNGDSSYVASSTYSLVTIRYVVQKRTYPTCTRTGIWWSGSEAGPSIDVAPARHGDKLCSVYGSSTTFVGGTFSIDAEL
jgi:hypothetical protein